MRAGELLSVRVAGRVRSALLLSVDAGRDYPCEVLLDGDVQSTYVGRNDVVESKGSVFDVVKRIQSNRLALSA